MYANYYLGKNETVKLMKIVPFAINTFFSCMMLLDIAKFYQIIGRKRENEINLGTPCQTLLMYSFIFFQQILNTAQDIAVNSHNPGFYGSYILVGENTS